MDFKSQANKISQFLKKHENIWRYEILDNYPASLTVAEESWINDLLSLSVKEWHEFESNRHLKTGHSLELHQFLKEIIELTSIDHLSIKHEQELEDWAYTDVKYKKRHEINIIAPYLKNLQKKIHFNKLIDIGGGVGHLSRIVSYYYQIPTISIDKEGKFQTIGKERLKRYRIPPGGAAVEFYQAEFSKNKINEIKEKVDEQSFTLGLHTCGDLAVEVIDTTFELNNRGFLNFGCCYHKLHNKNKFPLSQYYKNNFHIELTLYAFTLASRAHCQTSFEEFETKLLVKNFRQGLHLFLFHKLNLKTVFDVGEIHIRNYRGTFEDYVLDRLKYLNIDCPYTREDIRDFYHSEEISKILKRMFVLNLIRWQIGRVLELYILIDRAIYCQENNYHVELKSFFLETVSPRNIGLTAFKLDNEEDKS